MNHVFYSPFEGVGRNLLRCEGDHAFRKLPARLKKGQEMTAPLCTNAVACATDEKQFKLKDTTLNVSSPLDEFPCCGKTNIMD